MKNNHIILILTIFLTFTKHNLTFGENNNIDDVGYCEVGASCNDITISKTKGNQNKYIFYDVNPAEGFNLRRDVYMRMAIFSHNLKKLKEYKNVLLVLPPFSNLVHWKSKDVGEQKQVPWNLFFDVNSLKTFAPVVELYEVFDREKYVVFDRIFNLQNYQNPFVNGVFEDKWEIESKTDCLLMSNFWGYNNITYKSIDCVYYQGYSKMLKELLDLYPNDKMILFTNGQIPLHDVYGSKTYWKARMSMKFNKELISIAEKFIKYVLNCDEKKCDNFISVHWRRGDFAKYRNKDVPSIERTAQQIKHVFEKHFKNNKLNTVFIATDANEHELKKLGTVLEKFKINAKYFQPSVETRNKFKDGGVAIVEQIVCSRAAYFVGTHESTFSFRIQEEREILGFDSDTTFNRLCPDQGECEKPSRWLIER